MIKKMKQQFMLVSMGSFSLVLLVLFIVLNILNYAQNIQREEQHAIEFIEIQLGISDSIKNRSLENMELSKSKIENDTFKFEELFNLMGRANEPYFRPILNYFYVLYNSEGVLENTVIGMGETITEEEAQQLAIEIYSQEKDSGWSSYYRFIKHKLIDGRTAVIYVDAYRMIESIFQFVFLSAGIFITILILVCLLLWYFSPRAIVPLVKNIERQKEFISNASHEIKTPLAVLSTNNDLLEMIGMKNEWTQSNRKQIERLNALVEQMLLLARFDEGKVIMQLTNVNLSKIMMQRIEEMNVLIQEKSYQLINLLPDNVEVYTDEKSLKQIINVLLENAVKYHTNTEPIEIKWQSDKSELWIENSCEPMTEEERQQLFERFYRRDTARNREQGGSGIGLSIAQSIAQVAGIQLDTELKTATRICFKLIFK